MSNTNQIGHPGIRDKWEARICSEPLNQQVNTLADIQHQLDDTKTEIAKLEKKREMHERDLAYVAQLIASKLPPPVVAEARRDS
jgi:septal ring factor EnvC (AmiA/AmiB activator)